MSGGAAGGLIAGLLAAVLFGVAAVTQARAVRRQGERPDTVVAFWRRAVLDPVTMLVVGAYLAGFVLHAVAIWLLPLYLAQASIALSFPITAWLSRRLDAISGRRRLMGVLAITTGLAVLAATAGEAGQVVTGWAFAAVALLGVAVVAVLGVLSRDRSGYLIAGIAGVGYAGSAIAVRGVEASLSAPVILAALSVPAYGAVAFWLYSLSMHSDDVAPATGALILTQTAVPAIVGVALLGDRLPAGGEPVAVVGVVLALVGVQALSPTRRTPSEEATASCPDPAPQRPRRSRRSRSGWTPRA